MFAATYINFLQTLGTAILNSIWLGALVWLGFIAIHSLFNLSSSKKYLLSVVGELIIFLWFVVSFLHSLFFHFHSSTTINLLNNKWFNFSVLPIISFIYLLFLMMMLMKWIIRFHHTQQLYHQQLISVETQWQQWIEQKAQQLNIKKPIKIFISNYIYVPLTIGIFKPVILLPIAVANYLTVEELEAVLLHELSHIKRNDYLINLLLSLIETVLYFNPFIFYFKKMIKKERENICDDEVLLQSYAPVEYAESLLKLAKISLNKNEIVFAMSANNNQQQLLQRIQRITKTKTEQKNKFLFSILLALFLFLFATFALYIPHQNKTIKKEISVAALTKISSPIIQKNIDKKNNQTKKVKQKNIAKIKINKPKTDENLNIALQNLKQIIIPETQSSIEDYRKNLSGNTAQQLTDDSLKKRIKNYVAVNNISMKDFIKKIDSLKIEQKNYLASVEEKNINNRMIIPASYIEKDSLNQYVQHRQIKHFIIIPNTNAAPFYLIICMQNEDNEPLFIFVPYTPDEQQQAD